MHAHNKNKMANSQCELLPLPGSKSMIWGFFGFPAKDGQFVEKDKKKRKEVICKMCKKICLYWKYNEFNYSPLKQPYKRIRNNDAAK